MRAADAWCATPILVSDSAALCASVGVFGRPLAFRMTRSRSRCRQGADPPPIPSGVSWAQAQQVSQYCTVSNFCTVPHCWTDYMV